MNNYFKKLSSINCDSHVEMKGKLLYLKWSYAWSTLKETFPDASYEIHENQEGFPFWDSDFGADVKVSVTANGSTHTMRLPVMDLRNQSVKREKLDTVVINKTIMRCFTKAIAMHGVGLYLYHGEKSFPEPESVNGKVVEMVLGLTDNGKDKQSLVDLLKELGVENSKEILKEKDSDKVETWVNYLSNC